MDAAPTEVLSSSRLALSPDIELGDVVDPEILNAIQLDRPFPMPEGASLPIGQIGFQASLGKPPQFQVPGGSISIEVSGSAAFGAGVFSDSQSAMDSLNPTQHAASKLVEPSSPTLFVVVRAGYQSSVSGSYSHPIGVLASLSTTGKTSSSGFLACICPIGRGTGALTALRTAIGSMRLPRHLRAASELEPGVSIVADCEGALAISLAAKLGYDVNFVRQLELLRISRSLGARIDAGITATFSLNVSSNFRVVISRESEAPILRLRIFRESLHDLGGGVNLTIGVLASIPGSSLDFVKAVLGIHGLQVISDLSAIRTWPDPTDPLAPVLDLSKTPSRLPNPTALALLSATSQTDASTRPAVAAASLSAALDRWNALPSRTAALLWQFFASGDQSQIATLQDTVEHLSASDNAGNRQLLSSLLTRVSFPESPEGRWLESIATGGVLDLPFQLDYVRQQASATEAVLADGTLQRLHDFTDAHLNLAQLDQTSNADLTHLDPWLRNRLGDFVGKAIDSQTINQLKEAVASLTASAPKVQAAAAQALTDVIRMNMSASVGSGSTDRALLDASFSFDEPGAAALFRSIVEGANFDRILSHSFNGVKLQTATLSHEVRKTGDVQLHLPLLDRTVHHVNRGLGSVAVEGSGGRALVYQLEGDDQTVFRNRARSELAIFGKLLAGGSLLDAAVLYDHAQVAQNIRSAELRGRISPLIKAHLTENFSDDAAEESFYARLISDVNRLSGQNGCLGDFAANLQVSLPGQVLTGWVTPRSAADTLRATHAVSKVLQRKLREVIPWFYFSDLHKLVQTSATAPLLVWSCLPVANEVSFFNGEVTPVDQGRDPYWDWRNPDLRRAMVSSVQTASALASACRNAAARLKAADLMEQASGFEPNQLSTWISLALNGQGLALLQSLLYTEAVLIHSATAALRDVQSGHKAASDPVRVINRFADFGADMAQAFNQRLSVYSSRQMPKSLNATLLAEASRVLASEIDAKPVAMLTLYFLRPGHAFYLPDFLAGNRPIPDDILLTNSATNLRLSRA